MQKNKEHIYIIDDLRGIAILSVLFYHYFFVYYKNQELNNIFLQSYHFINDYVNLGAFGVSLFFLVSGFVIPMSLKGVSSFKNVYNFFIRRFFRLYPTYWFAILFIVLTVYFLDDTSKYTFRQVVINFTMMQDIFRTSSVDGVFWTLMIEIKFYILTAIFFYFNLLKNIKYIVVVLLLLLSITTLYYGYTHQPGTYLGNGLWAYLMLMYLGTSFYYYHIKSLSKRTLFYLVFLVSIYFITSYSFLPISIYGEKLGYSVATILAIIIFIYALIYKESLSNITTFFGHISYSFYLIHQVVGYILIEMFTNLFLAVPYSQLSTIVIMIIISSFMYKYIEKLSNNLGRNFVK